MHKLSSGRQEANAGEDRCGVITGGWGEETVLGIPKGVPAVRAGLPEVVRGEDDEDGQDPHGRGGGGDPGLRQRQGVAGATPDPAGEWGDGGCRVRGDGDGLRMACGFRPR